MKKFLIAAVALVMSGSAFAIDNEPEEGVTAQFNLGLTVSNIKDMPTNAKPGGTMGFKLEYMLPKAHGTYINAGVDWIMRGAKKDGIISVGLDPTQYEYTVKTNAHYLEIPIHVGFKYNIIPELGVFGELGPYFAIGVGGKVKTEFDQDGLRDLESSYKTFKKSQSGFQRWDAGLGFRVGAEYNQHYSLALGCDWGFTDMYTNDFREAWAKDPARLPGERLGTPKNFSFVMTFGYRF